MSLVFFLVFVGPYLALAVWNIMAVRNERPLQPATATAGAPPTRPGADI